MGSAMVRKMTSCSVGGVFGVGEAGSSQSHR